VARGRLAEPVGVLHLATAIAARRPALRPAVPAAAGHVRSAPPSRRLRRRCEVRRRDRRAPPSDARRRPAAKAGAARHDHPLQPRV
jgi:hypothetical protein